MPFDNSIINLIEDIETFTYRNQASIRVPKEWRERAWIMEVDIKISSIKREEYLSFSSNPANGQYGYAVLVMRDYCEIEVPISLPRQRLYYGIVYDAFVNYYSLYYSYITSRQLSFISNNQLVPIAQQLGLSVSIPPNQCPEQPLWIELPLREIYVKCFDGTQFDVEFSRRRLVEPLVLGECSYDGKSGMIDGGKDAGLPANGIAPNKAVDPNNPFDGLKPTTSIEDLGEWFNNKGDVLNNVDPDNAPPPDGAATPDREGWYLEIRWNIVDQSNCQTRNVILYRGIPRPEDSFLDVSLDRINTGLGCPSNPAPVYIVKVVAEDGTILHNLFNNHTILPVEGIVRYGFLPV